MRKKTFNRLFSFPKTENLIFKKKSVSYLQQLCRPSLFYTP